MFVQPADLEIGARFLLAKARPYRRVLITNASADTRAVEARTIEPNETSTSHTGLGLSWPQDVFSLTHIAVPFPIDDPLYGIEPPPAPGGALALGRLSPRGEKSVYRRHRRADAAVVEPVLSIRDAADQRLVGVALVRAAVSTVRLHRQRPMDVVRLNSTVT